MESDQIASCNLFNKDKLAELFQFIHACVDEICNHTEPTFRKFSNIDWTKEEFNLVHKFILTLLQNPCCLYIDEERMPLEYNELPEHVQQTILTCLRVRRNQLTDALLFKESCRHIPTLFDFDWRLKCVIGSSKMASIREPLLQLDLILREKQNEQILGLELNKDELESLINTIEAVAS